MKAYPPLPTRDDWTPGYLVRRGDGNRDFAFGFGDGQGAPSSDGGRYHSAVDWFAPALTGVAAPAPGVVIGARLSTDRTGQVFGGVLEIESADGVVWVMRHVQPGVVVGAHVRAGEIVAAVSPWDDGGEHLHLEVWRTRAGGYRHENMIDPRSIEWTEAADDEAEAIPDFFFEELPWDKGGTGPKVVGQAKGYANATIARTYAQALRACGWIISTIRGEDGRTYVLRWAPGTYGARFRFGPWLTENDRQITQLARQSNTGRTMRSFRGRTRSAYPWPATA
jgi:murein DD-endopeptidase MepM/ murein hydrolase activator NlpD